MTNVLTTNAVGANALETNATNRLLELMLLHQMLFLKCDAGTNAGTKNGVRESVVVTNAKCYFDTTQQK